ncbi:MAG: hypothetical protein U1E63_01735 [Burkholderiales bacterium]
MAAEFSAGNWQQAIGSSGTARAIAEILQLNGWGSGDITAKGLDHLRASLLKAGDINTISLPGLRPDRVPVLLGGFAIMAAIFAELQVKRMTVATGAMREGILYDLVGRFHHRDLRDGTVQQFMRRYHVDAGRLPGAWSNWRSTSSTRSPAPRSSTSRTTEQMLRWAARLHEVGLAIAHSGYHKHSDYILRSADMPGAARGQAHLGLIVLGHRGELKKMQGLLDGPERLLPTLALRLRPRPLLSLPRRRHAARHQLWSRRAADRDRARRGWLAEHPLTAAALENEIAEWKTLGIRLTIVPIRASVPSAAVAG